MSPRRPVAPRTLGGRPDIEAVANECGERLPSSEEPILRSVIRYFERTGTDIDVARSARGHTVDLLLRRIRAESLRAFAKPGEGPRPSEGQKRSYQRRLTYLSTKVKKVFLSEQVETNEVLLAAGLERNRLGKLAEMRPTPGLFSRLHKDARAGAGDGRRKRGTTAKKVSLDTTFDDLATLVSVDADGLWDRLVPWLQEHNFEVIDLEADADAERDSREI